MYKILLSSSHEKHTRSANHCPQMKRKILSAFTLDTRGETWLGGRKRWISLSQGYLCCFEEASNNPLYLLILGIYFKIFHSDFIHYCLTLA